jgi:cell division protease FtsH
MVELEEAIDRVMAGPERKTRLISDKEKEVIAYHEGGHALVAHVLPNTDPVHKISIIPRGRALGYTLTLPMEDHYLVAKTELLDELAMLLAGRVAEEMIFKDSTTGAQNDLERATKLARQMVCEYGMSEKLGPLTLGQKQEQVFLGKDLGHSPDYSPEIAYEIDKEIRRIVDEAWEKARKILKEKSSILQLVAKSLIEHETIGKDDLGKLLEGKKIKIQTKTSEQKIAVEKEQTAPEKRLSSTPGKLRPAES